MEKLGYIFAIAIFYGITSVIARHFTGIKPDGWRFWVYDMPAMLAGVLIGIFVLDLNN